MENMQEKKAQPQQPKQDIQMIRVEPCEEDQSVNIVLRSGMLTDVDKGKQPEEDGQVHKVAEKEVDFDLNCANKTFLEEKKNFVEASTLGSQEKILETNAS